jgi:hypothetical protein
MFKTDEYIGGPAHGVRYGNCGILCRHDIPIALRVPILCGKFFTSRPSIGPPVHAYNMINGSITSCNTRYQNLNDCDGLVVFSTQTDN